MRNLRRFLVTICVGFVVIGVTAAVMQLTQQAKERPRGGRFNADGPIPVLVAPAKVADVPVYIDGVGSAKALNTVLVRSQVDGKLLSVAFKEGQDVKRGDVLAQVDPAIYQAQYDQAVAKKAQDEAQLANAKIDLERYVRLAQTNSGSKQQADTQRALVAQLEALVKSDQAAIDNAKTMLDYTTIRAPIDGRTGIRQVDEGNLVRGSDATGIVVITQIQPISIFFSLPQQRIGLVNKAFAKGPLAVEAMAADNTTVVDNGVLRVVDNQVDQTTGTVKLKAEFPNPELQIWPGQFINVRMLVDTLKQVITVPTAAVQRGPVGTFVYVIAPDDTAVVRPVTVAQQDETRSVITQGLQVSDRVVTSGFARLTDKAKVTVTTSEDGTPPPARPGTPPGRPNRPGPSASAIDGAVASEIGDASEPAAGRRPPPADGAAREERRRQRREAPPSASQ